MRRSRSRRANRLIVLGVVTLLAIVAWSTASTQSEPPFRLYGQGEAGDSIVVYDEAGLEKGSAKVAADNSWYVDVDYSADEVVRLRFTVNGEMMHAEVSPTGRLQASVVLSPISTEDTESMDGEMMEEEATDSDMMESEAEDAEPMEEEEAMEDGQMVEDSYPDSGSGGLADQGPSTSALIGTILVLAALALGVGFWRVRSRA